MPHNDLTVLYEDHSLVLCVKPVGVLSEDSDSAASMPALLRAHYRSLHQPDYIATVHRLDKIDHRRSHALLPQQGRHR